MIPIASGVRVWIATGHTDMRRGMNSLALLVQEVCKRDPHGGDLYVFRGRRGSLIKILWHDGIGISLYAKRLAKELERQEDFLSELRDFEDKLRRAANRIHPVATALRIT